MSKNERDYLREVRQQIALRLVRMDELEQRGDVSDEVRKAWIEGQRETLRQVDHWLQEVLDFTNPELYVEAGESTGKRVWLDRDEGWMTVERVEFDEGRAILHGQLDGKDWEAGFVADEPLSLHHPPRTAEPTLKPNSRP